MTEHKNKLALTILSDTELMFVREFDFPRDLVFEAFTKPEHMRRWWGPASFKMTVCDMDFRVGGSYRYELVGDDGDEPKFKGEYREIERPKRLVFTQIYDVEPYEKSVAIVSIDLHQEADRTKLAVVITAESKEMRDGLISSGMEHGMAISYDQLDVLLTSLSGASI